MTSKTKTENMQSIKPTALQKASLFFIAIAMLALYSCNSSSGNGGGYQQPVPSLPVITINSMAATTYQEFSASLEGTKDIEIRPQNREAIAAHPLAPYITMLEGSSTAPEVVEKVRDQIRPGETAIVLLDSCHTRDHVLAELEAYAPMVTPGSYLVAMDGIMQDVVGAPRTSPDWITNNPQTAVREFLATHPEFTLEEPAFPFNEGEITDRVTYWPSAFVRRVR